LRKNVFYTYVLSYLDKNGTSLKNKYQSNLPNFKNDYKISDEMLSKFIDYATSKEVVFNEEEYRKDKDYIIYRIKAQIARNYWKNEGWYSVLLQTDEQLNKAMTLFIEAKELANLK
jgi:carboxyl-terminal processing protease